MNNIEAIIAESIKVKQRILENKQLLSTIELIVAQITDCFKRDGKLLLCGNGGSAADAQHISAEFSGRFYKDRAPLFSEALHVNSSYLTAVANDYGFQEVYARMVRAMGRNGDILIGISTSGNSPNITNALEAAKQLGMTTIGFTGETGGKIKSICDHLINIPSTDTPRIQEAHILVGHIICELVESNLYG